VTATTPTPSSAVTHDELVTEFADRTVELTDGVLHD
jgi:ABC-type lipoprotein export system ATPase subunit